MGTWSHDAFGNDSACDWAHGLSEVDDLSLVEDAIARALEGEGIYLDASDATDALAAIETVARLRGHFGLISSYTKVVDDWVRRTRLTPSDALVSQALAALEKVLGKDSELKDLWEESDQAQDWIASVEELKARLVAKPKPMLAEATAPPLESTPHAPSSSTAEDDVAQMLRRIGEVRFSHPVLSPNATPVQLHRAVMISGALCETTYTRHLISRIWQPLANLEKEAILWDMAVREAQTWALEGRLDEALAVLEPWRISPAASGPGQFDIRAAGVCLTAHDLERARTYHAKACEAAPTEALWHLDRALMEARLGSAEHARDILETEDLHALPEAARPAVTLIQGILACRNQEPAALSLLTEATNGYLDKVETSPAAWSLFAICCGWLALALGQAEQHDQAATLLRLVAPILIQPHHRELLIRLKDHRLLADDIPIPALSVASTSQTAAPTSAASVTDVGPFKTVCLPGVSALKQVEVYRRAFANGSRLYPFLVGDENDLSELLQGLSPPEDGGRAHIAEARALNVAAWLKEHSPKSAGRWPKETVPTLKTPLSLFHTLSQELKATMVIGLIELDHPSELFARMGYGDWNGCPPPSVHMALHAYWHHQYAAEPIAISASVVECLVAKPPTDKADALKLARAHRGYCDDVVEQGLGTTGRLASSLLEAKYWYFWWD